MWDAASDPNTFVFTLVIVMGLMILMKKKIPDWLSEKCPVCFAHHSQPHHSSCPWRDKE